LSAKSGIADAAHGLGGYRQVIVIAGFEALRDDGIGHAIPCARPAGSTPGAASDRRSFSRALLSGEEDFDDAESDH
jgi:hypothetical protein